MKTIHPNESAQLNEMIRFSRRAHYSDLDQATVEQLKRHLLDSVASLIFSLRQEPPKKLMRQVAELQLRQAIIPLKKLPLDRSAELLTSLIRYPDFMDNFLGKHATCHPSDNIGALLAAGNFKKIDGKQFLKAMGIAYQLICRLTESFPVMSKGFDHTVLLNFSIVLALAEILGLSEEATRHACGMAACTLIPLVTLRASYTSEWKGFASSCIAFNCVNKAILAKQGMTGPYSIFEGPMAMNKVMGMELEHNWKEEQDFSLIKKCILKSYNAEVHSQSLIEGVIELTGRNAVQPGEIKEIDIITFLTCYHIIGGGEYGDRKVVVSKEQADHSLPYLIAVAILDRQVLPEQFSFERINKDDVQELMKKVKITTGFPLKEPRKLVSHLDPYTTAYPDKMMGKIKIHTSNGVKHEIEKEDYHGFFTRPLQWEDVGQKFLRLTSGIINASDQERVITIIQNFEKSDVSDLLDIINEIEIFN